MTQDSPNNSTSQLKSIFNPRNSQKVSKRSEMPLPPKKMFLFLYFLSIDLTFRIQFLRLNLLKKKRI